jgi:hypothetical protein
MRYCLERGEASEINSRVPMFGLSVNVAEHLYNKCCQNNVAMLSDREVENTTAAFSLVLQHGGMITPNSPSGAYQCWPLKCKCCSSSQSPSSRRPYHPRELSRTPAARQTRTCYNPFEQTISSHFFAFARNG